MSISGLVDRASATETVDLGSIFNLMVKPKSRKIGVQSFSARYSEFSFKKGSYKTSAMRGRNKWQLDSKDRGATLLSPGKENLVIKNTISITNQLGKYYNDYINIETFELFKMQLQFASGEHLR